MSEGDFWRQGFRDDDGPSTGQQRLLAETIKTYKEWLHLPDAGIVYVALATVVVNRLECDPVWVLLVGASGGGKTEVIQSLRRLPDVKEVSTISGEAALLSGSPNREKDRQSTGGLLREIGAYGLVTVKDFTSMLSMNRDARTAIFAALREIYDGEWTRALGANGGKTLTWEGKIGMLGGVTTAIDSHHAVLAAMGERFISYRLPAEDRMEQGRRALKNVGKEAQLRRALAGAADRFYAGTKIPDELPPLTDDENESLLRLAALVTMARSAVDRDGHSRELELIHDAEAPTRLAQTLGRLNAGLRIIGLGRDYAWRLTRRSGLDCMPKMRRTVFDHLAAHADGAGTVEIATAVGYPTSTARRALEELAAHSVVIRSKKTGGNDDYWCFSDDARSLYEASIIPEMSEDTPRSRNVESSLYKPHTQSDFSGTHRECQVCGAETDGSDLCERCESEVL